MTTYAKSLGRRKYPGHRERKMALRATASPQPEIAVNRGESATTIVAVGSRINGVVKSAISPEILAKTEGLPWHRRIARIHALTAIPFTEINTILGGREKN